MDKNNDEGPEYASMRVLAETNRKLKVLSGLVGKSSLSIVKALVDKEYTRQLARAARETEV